MDIADGTLLKSLVELVSEQELNPSSLQLLNRYLLKARENMLRENFTVSRQGPRLQTMADQLFPVLGVVLQRDAAGNSRCQTLPGFQSDLITVSASVFLSKVFHRRTPAPSRQSTTYLPRRFRTQAIRHQLLRDFSNRIIGCIASRNANSLRSHRATRIGYDSYPARFNRHVAPYTRANRTVSPAPIYPIGWPSAHRDGTIHGREID